MAPVQETLLTVIQAAERLGVGRTLVYTLMERGELPFVKIGRTRRLRPIHLDELIRRNTIGADCES
jgi:excisionase family DNA binding protein